MLVGMKDCMMKAAEVLRPEKQRLSTNVVFFNMVIKNVNDLAWDIRCQLKEKCKYFVPYFIALDEGPDVQDIIQLTFF